jgi:hypothetical protein
MYNRDDYNRMLRNGRRYAMFNRDANGIIVGYCDDSFCMSYRYHCVAIWNYAPLHYFKPQCGDFIVCVNRKYDDLRILPLTRNNHAFKGNYLFEQKDSNGNWVIHKDVGKVFIEGMK